MGELGVGRFRLGEVGVDGDPAFIRGRRVLPVETAEGVASSLHLPGGSDRVLGCCPERQTRQRKRSYYAVAASASLTIMWEPN